MDTAGHFLRVRSVVGRSTDLYRGVNADASTPREPSPAVPLARVLELLRTLDGITVTHARGKIVLARSADEEDLELHVDEDAVTVHDLNFEGNPEIAIRALHALLPVFGAVELRDDDYTQIIDSSEPIEVAIERYQGKAREYRAKIQARIGGIEGDIGSVEPLPIPRARRYSVYALIAVMAIVVPLVGLWAFRTATRRADVGDACTRNKECESGECLSADPIETNLQDDGSPMMRARPAIRRGVCTQTCRDDSECPKSMVCAKAVMDSGVRGQPFELQRCTPVGWVDQSAN